MSDTVIHVENVSKQYRLGEVGMGTMRHDFNRWWHKVRGKEDPYIQVGETNDRTVKGNSDYVWALKDINFEVKRGEVLGIIGRNGAGKSTLLKILSRVTLPTSGQIKIKGRIASLLEVGTGFNPELTGRDNIYLNGAILGMRKREIDSKFDEIVDFSGVERYIDTPVKRYSSGMYVRLAFAVAAHLEPEILIIDEVLAVGDDEFQKKCLGKMRDVAGHGRTVLFVSHNMLAVQKLCARCVLLAAGGVKASGLVEQIVSEHLFQDTSNAYTGVQDPELPRVLSAKILTKLPRIDMALEIMVEWFLPQAVRGIKVGIGFNTPEGQRIFDFVPEDLGFRTPEDQGLHRATFRIPPNTFMARNYNLSVGLWKESHVFDHASPALRFAVEVAPVGPYSHQSTRDGLVQVNCEWNILPKEQK